jgi:MSHA biogenesis protein MshN
MSLINKMLNDLEQRQRTPADTIGGQTGIQPVDPAPSIRKPLSSSFLILLLGAGLVYGAWLYFSDEAANRSPATIPPVVVAPTSAPTSAPAAASPAGTPLPLPLAAAPSAQPVQQTPPSAQMPAQPVPAATMPPTNVATASPTGSATAPTVPAIAMPPSAAASAGAAPAPSQPINSAGSFTKSEPRPAGTTAKSVSPEQRADLLFREAVQQNQRGESARAISGLAEALSLNPRLSEARLTLAILYSQRGERAQAIELLSQGLQIDANNVGLSLGLARLQWDAGLQPQAQATLEKNLMSALRDAAYQGFYGTVLQSTGKHEAAIKHFVMALQIDANNPAWMVGVGMSFEALGQKDSARDAYERALATGRLSPGLLNFVNQKLRGATK